MYVEVYARVAFEPEDYGRLVHRQSLEVGALYMLDVIEQARYEALCKEYGRLNVRPAHEAFSERDIYQAVIDIAEQIVFCVEDTVGGGIDYRTYDETIRETGWIHLETETAVRAARALVAWADRRGQGERTP